MVLRLVTIWVKTGVAAAEAAVLANDGEIADEPVTIGARNLIGIASALLFAYFLVPVVGFYISGFLLLGALMRIMGETRLLALLWQPALVVGLIWGLFDRIFSVNLPAGVLFGG